MPPARRNRSYGPAHAFPRDREPEAPAATEVQAQEAAPEPVIASLGDFDRAVRAGANPFDLMPAEDVARCSTRWECATGTWRKGYYCHARGSCKKSADWLCNLNTC